MKQQILENKLEKMADEIVVALSHLELFGRYDDTPSIVKSAMNSLENALKIYASENISTSTVPD